MSAINPIITTAEEQFVVGESDFSYFNNYANRCEGGAILFCRKGSAHVTVNQYGGLVKRNTLVLVLPGSMLMLTERTDDFRMTFCAFSHDIFSEAAFRLRLEPSFFRTLRENPIAYPIRNRLQNVLMEIYDKLQRFVGMQRQVPESTTRQTELFHRFVAFVHEFGSQEREVSFYADKLCISTRYLSTIVRSVAHSSAKEFIDRSVMLEIKMMLQSTDLSVQEIAYRLRFPDQSYLGRFFKKHAGESPTEYRNNKK